MTKVDDSNTAISTLLCNEKRKLERSCRWLR
jgi:hypothetical protein